MSMDPPQIIKHILILSSTIALINAEISFIKTHQFLSLTPITNNIISNQGFTNFYTVNATNGGCSFVNQNSGLPYTFQQQGKILPVPDTIQFRAMQNNRIRIQQNFMYFTQQQIHYTKDFWKSNSKIMYTALTNQKILDTIYGNNGDQSFNVVKDININMYKIIYNNKTATGKKLTGISLNYNFIRIIRNDVLVYLLFKQCIDIYTANGALNFVKFIQFPSVPISMPKISINNSLVLYSLDKTFYLLDSVNGHRQILNYTMNTSIQGMALTQQYILINSNKLISQHDISLNASLIHNISYNQTNKYMQMSLGQFIYFPPRYPDIVTYIAVYHADNRYPSVNGSGCVVSYYWDYSASRCVKNSSYYMGGVSVDRASIQEQIYVHMINITNNNTNYTNTINNTNYTNNSNNSNDSNISVTNASVPTNSSNIGNNSTINATNNNTINNTTTNTSNIPNIITQPIPIHYTNYRHQQLNSPVADNIGKVLTFSVSQLSPKFLLSFIQYLDDLWYYKYHRVYYPPSALYFMQRVDIINQLRLNPWFLQSLEQYQIASIDNQLYAEQLSYHSNNPDQLYFVHSTQQTYKQCLIFNIISYLFIKLVQIGTFALRHKSNYFLQIALWIGSNSRWWTFLTMMLQTNMMKLAFESILQMYVSASFRFQNKINMCGAVLVLLSLVLYSVLFYPFVYEYSTKQAAKTLLIRCNYRMSSFFVQSFSLVCRNFFRSLIHAFLIENYQTQILMLTLSDILFSFLCMGFKKKFTNRYFFSLFLTYNIVFFIIDLCFFLHSQNCISLTQDSYDIMIFVWMCILIILASLLSLGILYILLNQSVKKMLASQLKPSNTIVIELKQKKNTYCPNQIIIPVQLRHSINRNIILEKKKKLEITETEEVQVTQQQLIISKKGIHMANPFKVIFQQQLEQQDKVSFQQQIDQQPQLISQQHSSDKSQSNQKLLTDTTVMSTKKQQRKITNTELKIILNNVVTNNGKNQIQIIDMVE